MVSDIQRLQASLNGRIATHVPTDAWDAIVAIVIANKPAVHLLGTGCLFEIAGDHFVITAAHVVQSASAYDRTIGISADLGSFVSVHGNWISSAPVQFGSSADPFDVAVYRLPAEAIQRLRSKRFLRREDIDFSEQSATGVFTILGFPGIWAAPSRGDDERVSVRPLEYTTHAYAGSTETLIGYNPKYHLLLDSDPKDITLDDGSHATLFTRDGRPATIPGDLRGISGCAVWRVGDLSLSVERWRDQPAKVVAVETGVYQGSQVVRGTRWAAVTTLIHEAFPELRGALGLWTPT